MKTADEWFAHARAALERSKGADRSHEYDRDLQDALEAFNQAIAVDASHLPSQRERGFLLAHLGEHEAAMDSFVAAASLGPVDAGLQLAAGASSLVLKSFERALAAFDDVLRVRPGDDVALVGRAEALTGLERDELALAAWDEAIRVLETRQVEHHGKLIRDLTDDYRATKAREARAKVSARR